MHSSLDNVRASELLALVRGSSWPLASGRRYLTVEDYRRRARRMLPTSVFDFVDGGADDECSVDGNVKAFHDWQFHPEVLNDVSTVDTSCSILGGQIRAPIGLSPTGYTRMVSPDGETAVAAAAAEAGVPYVVSTMASTRLEDVPAGRVDADRWFQLYALRDHASTLRLIRRAEASGYRILEVSVDTAVAGARIRDERNGLTIPPSLGWASRPGNGFRPGYWMRILAAPRLEFANLAEVQMGSAKSVGGVNALFDPGLSWSKIAEIRRIWPGKLVLKGPIGPGDARRALNAGVDGLHLSNHGGRQLDRIIAPLNLVRPVRDIVGPECAILVDSGVRNGGDVAIALALGADAAFIGRPYLWGLAVDGQAGVRSVVELFVSQLRRTMALLGVSGISDFGERGRTLVSRL